MADIFDRKLVIGKKDGDALSSIFVLVCVDT